MCYFLKTLCISISKIYYELNQFERPADDLYSLATLDIYYASRVEVCCITSIRVSLNEMLSNVWIGFLFFCVEIATLQNIIWPISSFSLFLYLIKFIGLSASTKLTLNANLSLSAIQARKFVFFYKFSQFRQKNASNLSKANLGKIRLQKFFLKKGGEKIICLLNKSSHWNISFYITKHINFPFLLHLTFTLKLINSKFTQHPSSSALFLF